MLLGRCIERSTYCVSNEPPGLLWNCPWLLVNAEPVIRSSRFRGVVAIPVDVASMDSRRPAKLAGLNHIYFLCKLPLDFAGQIHPLPTNLIGIVKRTALQTSLADLSTMHTSAHSISNPTQLGTHSFSSTNTRTHIPASST